MKKSQMISPSEVLKLPKDAAAQIMRGLDETNRYVLITGMVRLVLHDEAYAAPRSLESLSSVFTELGPARLKLHAHGIMLNALNAQLPSKACACRSLDAVHAVLTPLLLDQVFGVPAGLAGAGVRPQLGLTNEDRIDLVAMRAGTLNVEARYEPLVAAARAAGTLIIEDSV